MFKEFFERIYNELNRIRKKFLFEKKELAKIPKKAQNLTQSENPENFAENYPKNFSQRIKLFCKKRGSAVLEATLCLPILLVFVFFALEAIRIGVYQIAVDNMALQLAFEYGALKSSTNFEKVVAAAKPEFFKSMDGIHCNITLYPDLKTLISSTASGYGGITDDPTWESSLVSFRYPGGTYSATSGTAIVVTVSYKFPFSSAFIKQMFAGGKNYGSNFLLWGRAVNVCN